MVESFAGPTGDKQNPAFSLSPMFGETQNETFNLEFRLQTRSSQQWTTGTWPASNLVPKRALGLGPPGERAQMVPGRGQMVWGLAPKWSLGRKLVMMTTDCASVGTGRPHTEISGA